MENNLVRTEDLFGSKKNIIGSNTSDLILETLGKIYVKTGNKTRVLNDVFKLLDNLNKDNSGTKTIITTALERLKYPGDGYLVFDTSKNALKDAVLETGLKTKVQLFIEEGDDIIVSTEDGSYVSRA